jgi:selenocysteine lyase/cysteine desulfurase
MPFREYRKYFPVTLQKIYLNHAAISPLSTRVTDKMDWFLDERSFGGIDILPQVDEIRNETRKMAAKLINARDEQIAFITNTSEGFNCLVNGLSWQEGDQIILTDYEFPSNVYPFKNLERFGVEIIFVPNRNGQIFIEDIREKITPRTKLLSISFVEFSNGFRNDLGTIGKLCKECGIIFSVDSIQGLGAIPLDVQKCKIDFLSNGGHKWLMGPMGAGFMYMHPDLFKRIVPVYTGWLAVEDAWDFLDYKLDLLPNARRFEYATANFLGVTGLSASLELLLEAGIEKIEKHLLNLGSRLIQGLQDQGLQFNGAEVKQHLSGIYSFAGKKMDGLFNYLEGQGIVCSLRNGMLRISPHFYNTIEEIDELIENVKKFNNSPN